MSIYSAPNRIVWDYFFSLRHLVQEAKEAKSQELERRSSALAVVMAATATEVFLNLWFRVHIEKKGSPKQRRSLLNDLSSRKSLQYKLKQWPSQYLFARLDLKSGAGAEFNKLKSLRNSIVHFTSSHETIDFAPGITITGMANTSRYDSLCADDAIWALQTAENFVAEIFHLAGVTENEIPRLLHAWIAKPQID
jgi:hypothetical protein